MFSSIALLLVASLAAAVAQHGGYGGPQGGYGSQGGYAPQQQQQQYAPPQNNYVQQTSPRPQLPSAIGFLHDQSIDGQYKFAYQTQDGQTRAENTGSDGAIRGSYAYTSPEGQNIKVSYTADKNGFHADSDHIPRAPQPSAAAAAPAPQPQQYAPPPQEQYNPPPQQHYAPQQQYQAPQQQHYSAPPSYPDQSYDYSQQRAGPSYSNAPLAQYAYGDPKVVSGLQNLFG